MLFIGLNGSPKKEGNTAFILKTVLNEISKHDAEIKLIHVQDLIKEAKLPYCVVCSNPCNGSCFENTALEDAYNLLKKADALILGSPVYFGTVSAQLKCFWDKTRKLRGEKGLLNTVGAAVSTGGARFGGQETTLKALYDMMLVQGMIIVGDGYKENDAGHHGVCSQQPSAADDFALDRALILANRVLEVAESTKKIRIN